MIASTSQAVKSAMVTIRIIGDSAIVPSSKGPHCYRVGIKLGVPTSCDCPARRKLATAPCKHMIATREALAETARTGFDTAAAELVPQTRKALTKPVPTLASLYSTKPVPTLASLYSTKPAPTWTDAQRRNLAAHFAEFEAAVW